MESQPLGNWVSTKTVNLVVTMTAAMKFYRLSGFRIVGDDLVGGCPICRANETDCFCISPNMSTFRCVMCGSRGTVLDFVAAMEKCSTTEAEQKLSEWFSISAVVR